jgi:hypothetical protein
MAAPRPLISNLVVTVAVLTSPALVRVQPFPPDYKAQTISTNGAKIRLRIGGNGCAVVLLHGYGENLR